MDDAQRALAEAERVLRQNWREGEADGIAYAYTEPSPGRYPWQWYWDSCFAAIANRRFEPDRSRAELESLLAVQRPDGFIGHTILWGRPVSGFRRAFYNVASRSAKQTETIQPPLLAWAWRLAVGDPADDPRIGAQADWLAANRDLEGDGLLWIVQGDESGLDASPKFDPVWGRRSVGRVGFPLLVERNRRLGWDARRIRDYVLIQVEDRGLGLSDEQLEALNRRLREANNDLEDFANIVSHDLRAPLRGIFRVSEWLEDSIGKEDQVSREHLALLKNRAEKMDKMINGILLYSRVGSENVEPAEVDTRAVLEDVMLSLSPILRWFAIANFSLRMT